MSTVSIPAFHVSDKTKVTGGGEVYIQSRQDAVSAGIFKVKIAAQFDPAVNDYPTGNVHIEVQLSDGAKGSFDSTTIELINSYGKHSPVAYLTGQCKDSIQPDAKGCRYWVMIANNKKANINGTPDIAGFVIHDNTGNRIAYGTGPVRSGDFEVAPK